MDIWMELEHEGVDASLLWEVRAFHDAHPAAPEAAGRVPQPRFLYYGREIWEANRLASYSIRLFAMSNILNS